MAFQFLLTVIKKNKLMAINFMLALVLFLFLLAQFLHNHSDLYLDSLQGVVALETLAFSLYVLWEYWRSWKKQNLLLEKQERDRFFMGIAEEVMFIREGDIIVEVNDTLAQMLGYRPEEMVGQPVFNFMDTVSAEENQKWTRAGYPTERQEILAKRKNGSTFPILIHGRNIVYKGREMWLSCGWDITELKKMQTAIVESEERFKKFSEATREGLLVHDRGVIVDVNQTLLDMLGMTRDEFVGKDSFFFLDENSAKLIQRIRSGEIPMRTFEITMIHKNGNLIPAETHGMDTIWKGKTMRMAKIWNLTERKKIEQALLESQTKIQRFSEGMKEGVIVHYNGLIIEANQVMSYLTGYSIPELLGKSTLDLLDDESAARIRRVYESGVYPTNRYELNIERKDGVVFPAEGYDVDFVNDGKQYRVTRIWDLSEQKRSKEELERSESSFKSLVEQSPDGVFLHANNKLLYVNNAFAKMMGCTETAELVGKETSFLLHPDDLAIMRTRLRNLKEVGSSNPPAEFRFVRYDGSIFYGETTSFSIYFGGELVVVVIVRDLTERRKMLEAIREAEERFRRFAEVTREGILVHDHGVIVDGNQALADILGTSIEALIGHHNDEFLSPDSRKLMEKYRVEGYPTTPYEVTVRRADGAFIPVEAYGSKFMVKDKVYRVTRLWDITERKKNEEALMRSETSFRNLIEKSPDGMVFHTLDRVVYANEAIVKMMGYIDTQDFLSRHPNNFIHPEDISKIKERVQQLRNEGDYNPPAERRLIRKDGTLLWVEAVSFSLYFQGERVVVAIIRDLTERKKAEEEIRKSEEKFRNLIENSHDVISITGENRSMTYISPSVKRVLGYEPSERIGNGYAPIMHPDDLPRISEEFRKLLNTKNQPITVEFRLKHKDGSWREVESTGFNLLDNPAVRGIVYNMRDVTERNNAEKLLRDSQERFERFAEVTREGILIHDKGVIIDFNQALLDLTGYSRGEVQGRNTDEFLDKKSVELIHKFRAEGYSKKPYEIGLIRKDGKIIPVEGHGAAFNFFGRELRVVRLWDITERKNFEKALLESQERFQRFFEVAKEGILIHEDNISLDANQALAEMMGYELSELVGKEPEFFFEKKDAEKIREFAKAKKFPMGPYEARVLRRDGGLVPVEVHGARYDFGGRKLRVVRFWDITERKKAEEALRQSEKNFRNLIENSPDGVLIHNLEGEPKIIYINEAMSQFVGYQPSELIGKRADFFVHPDYKANVQGRIDRLRSQNTYNPPQEKVFFHKNGEKVYTEAVSFHIFYEGTQMAAVVARDLTERKKAEEAARKNEEQFQRIYQDSPIGMALIGLDSSVLSTNAKMSQILGYPREEMIGKSFTDMTYPRDLELDMQNARKLFAGEIDGYKIEKRFLHKDGRIVWGHLTATVVRDSDGKALYGLGMVEDITESKKTQELLMRFERLSAIGEMAAGMAHEIRNPLAAISAAAQVLKRKKPKEDSGQLETILQQSDRLEKLVRDTLDYSKPKALLSHQSFLLKEALESAVRLSEVQFGPAHKKVKILWDLPAQDIRMKMDLGRFQQILVNLILNAFQVLKENGVVKIGFYRSDRSVLIRVEDNGPGITDKDLARIFEPFFTTKETGSGLGLAISQRIAQEYGGTINVENIRPNGVAFILKLPCEGESN